MGKELRQALERGGKAQREEEQAFRRNRRTHA